MDSKTRRIWRYSKGSLGSDEKENCQLRGVKRKALPSVSSQNETPAKMITNNKSESSLRSIQGNELTFKEKIGTFLQKFRTDLSLIAKSPNPRRKSDQARSQATTVKNDSNCYTPGQTIPKKRRPFKTKSSCSTSGIKTPVRKYKTNPLSRSLDRVRLEELGASSRSLPTKSQKYGMEESTSSPNLPWKQRVAGDRSLPRARKHMNNNYIEQNSLENNGKSPQRYKSPSQKLTCISTKVENKGIVPMETLSDALGLIVATGIYTGVKNLYEKIWHQEEEGLDYLQNFIVEDMMQLGEAGEHATRFLLAVMASQHLKRLVHDAVLVICDKLQDIQ